MDGEGYNVRLDDHCLGLKEQWIMSNVLKWFRLILYVLSKGIYHHTFLVNEWVMKGYRVRPDDHCNGLKEQGIM